MSLVGETPPPPCSPFPTQTHAHAHACCKMPSATIFPPSATKVEAGRVCAWCHTALPLVVCLHCSMMLPTLMLPLIPCARAHTRRVFDFRQTVDFINTAPRMYLLFFSMVRSARAFHSLPFMHPWTPPCPHPPPILRSSPVVPTRCPVWAPCCCVGLCAVLPPGGPILFWMVLLPALHGADALREAGTCLALSLPLSLPLSLSLSHTHTLSHTHPYTWTHMRTCTRTHRRTRHALLHTHQHVNRTCTHMHTWLHAHRVTPRQTLPPPPPPCTPQASRVGVVTSQHLLSLPPPPTPVLLAPPAMLYSSHVRCVRCWGEVLLPWFPLPTSPTVRSPRTDPRRR